MINVSLFAVTLVIGVLLGLVAGALGIGGGILAIPVLVYLLGQEPHLATAESLVIVLVTSAAALPSRFANHQVRLGTGLVFGLSSTIGAFIGTKLNALADAQLVMVTFAVLLVGVAVTMTRKGISLRGEENAALTSMPGEKIPASTAETHQEKHLSARSLPLFLLIGTVTGMMVGFFGIGGGFMMVPVLVLLMGYTMRVAAGTSFIVISVVSLVALSLRMIDGIQINWIVALLVAAGSGIGSAIGSPLSNKARASTLTFVFVALLLAVAIYTTVVSILG